MFDPLEDSKRNGLITTIISKLGEVESFIREHKSVLHGSGGSGFSSGCTLDVKEFGAVGDGVTDDAVAIQDAIDYAFSQGGGVVCFPTSAGYAFGTAIVLKDGVSIQGDGVTPIQAIGNIFGIEMVGNHTIRNIVLVGTNPSPTVDTTGNQFGLYFPSGEIENVLVEGVTTRNWGGNGIHFASPIHVTIKDCHSYDNAGEGIFTSYGANARNVRIVRNLVHDNGYNGIDTNCNYTIIEENEVYNNGLILVSHASGTDTNGIVVGAIGGVTPYNGDLSHVIVSKNSVYSNWGYGILIVAADDGSGNVGNVDDVIISENHIHDNSDSTSPVQGGILAVAETGCAFTNINIINNTVESEKAFGIMISNQVGKFSIDGNIITDCVFASGPNAIWLNGGSGTSPNNGIVSNNICDGNWVNLNVSGYSNSITIQGNSFENPAGLNYSFGANAYNLSWAAGTTASLATNATETIIAAGSIPAIYMVNILSETGTNTAWSGTWMVYVDGNITITNMAPSANADVVASGTNIQVKNLNASSVLIKWTYMRIYS